VRPLLWSARFRVRVPTNRPATSIAPSGIATALDLHDTQAGDRTSQTDGVCFRRVYSASHLASHPHQGYALLAVDQVVLGSSVQHLQMCSKGGEPVECLKALGEVIGIDEGRKVSGKAARREVR